MTTWEELINELEGKTMKESREILEKALNDEWQGGYNLACEDNEDWGH